MGNISMPEGRGNINLECDFIELDDMMNTTERQEKRYLFDQHPSVMGKERGVWWYFTNR